jgi:hypothetical protein
MNISTIRKALSTICLVGFASALVTPVHAARSVLGPVVVVTTATKAVVSAP